MSTTVAPVERVRESLIRLRNDAKVRGFFHAVETYGWSIIRMNSELMQKRLPPYDKPYPR